MCMARSVVVGKCNDGKEDSDLWKQKWEHVNKSKKSSPTVENMKLLHEANIPHGKPCGIEEYKMIQGDMASDYLI